MAPMSLIIWNNVSEAAMAAPSPNADRDIRIREASIPPRTVAKVLNRPCIAPFVRQSAADGPGVTMITKITDR
jgi:hypothetical protein